MEAVDRAEDVDLDRATVNGGVGFRKRAERQEAGVGDERVERALYRLSRGDEGLDRGEVGDVERKRDRAFADLGRRALGGLMSMSPIATRAPRATSNSAVARPMPRAPPVRAIDAPARKSRR